ncbi:YidC/Oxa1 family membrane protein insertase [Pelotomaculum terephthalicicum JT]|uniref:YidC/Oxa1 family membrane protein insertase n=1 Tax=Pelotomaculum terephthalicicum TaxID=206393 RepID=UPI001F045DA0|nr:YidC/Oxa1 family membrane protein insertase [Pelotomaculum terephthalicicum]MCG9966852.1 YidC/Oxa1 family membrane protein insertase [Pelotomaculum terephthalicicum JT]
MEIFNALVDGMTGLMNWLYQLTVQAGVPSYGIAIILLTVLIKMLLYPLTQKQMKSMVVMQRLQPKVKQIQDKWKNKDPKKMQQMIMDLYKENNANPMAGCLPLLIQLPILIALYRSLYAFPFINEAHASFIWVQNLSGTDPYYILPLLAGITTFLQSKMTTSMTDPTQKTMLYMMPLIIVWISATVPAGLALYWVVFNVVGAIQQYFINKQNMPVKEGASGR